MSDTPARTRLPVRRILIGFNVVVLTAVVAAASVFGYGWWRLRQVETVDLPAPSVGTPVSEPETPLDPGGPRNYLLVGSDTREGQDAESVGTPDDSGTVNADTIILVRVDPQAVTVDLVSFVRDIWLPIFDRDGNALGEQRINTALAGEAAGLKRTIEENFGIPIHHFAQVDFAGFQELVDAIGGLEVPLQHSVRDWNPGEPEKGIAPFNPTGLDIQITEPECRTLDGTEALAYLRSRYFQEWIDGEWVADPTSDIGRARRQRDTMRRAIGQAIAEGRTSPQTVRELFGVAQENVTIDERLRGSPGRLVAIANAFRAAPPEAIRNHELVTEPFRTSGGAAVLRLDPEIPANEAVLDIFRGDAPPPPPPPTPAPGGPQTTPVAPAPPPSAPAAEPDLCG